MRRSRPEPWGRSGRFSTCAVAAASRRSSATPASTRSKCCASLWAGFDLDDLTSRPEIGDPLIDRPAAAIGRGRLARGGLDLLERRDSAILGELLPVRLVVFARLLDADRCRRTESLID